MRFLVSGASGLVGSALRRELEAAGHQVRRLVRRPSRSDDEASWDPAAGKLDESSVAGVDVVVHLAGENIAGGRWSKAFKQRILDSRVSGTRLVAEAVARAEPRPALISASAIGYYGDRGQQQVDEKSPPGEGFLAGVCQRWEAATGAATEAGARVVLLRIGVVLSRHGGALQRMLTPFRLGLGGVVGGGRQIVSWIHLEDLVASIVHLASAGEVAGPCNAVAPAPVAQRQLTRELGAVLKRPTVVPMPAAVVRLALGEMGQELLLASTRVVPERLLESGFEFRFEDLASALRHELGG